MSQAGLFDRKERSNVFVRWTDHSNDRREYQDDEFSRQDKDNACSRHQERAQKQRSFSAKPVCRSSEPQRNDRVADQSEGEQQPNLYFAQAKFGKIQS